MYRIVTITLLLLFLVGCYANKPIGDAGSSTFDERLLGKWLWPEEGESQHIVLIVARFNEKEYLVGPEEKFELKELLRVFTTKVGPDTFFNAQNLDNGDVEDRRYMFARYTFLDNDTVKLDIPGLDALPHEVASSEQLVEALRDKRSQPGFYDKQLLIRRIKEK